jgi:nucleoside-diphosphate-sugar epimerase
MDSDFTGPVNLGSERMISINDLAMLIMRLVDKQLLIKNIDGPIGVMGRNSDNTLIFEKLNWKPKENLEYGLVETYKFISHQLKS